MAARTQLLTFLARVSIFLTKYFASEECCDINLPKLSTIIGHHQCHDFYLYNSAGYGH